MLVDRAQGAPAVRLIFQGHRNLAFRVDRELAQPFAGRDIEVPRLLEEVFSIEGFDPLKRVQVHVLLEP
jgi:hypothetical protein